MTRPFTTGDVQALIRSFTPETRARVVYFATLVADDPSLTPEQAGFCMWLCRIAEPDPKP